MKESVAVLVRAIIYAVLFIGLVLIYAPARLLERAGIVSPETIGVQQIAGIVIGTLGMAVALWCVFTFTSKGKGTPAPFDAPRKLVVQGPYRYIRNPMYLGAGVALAAAALYYGSMTLLVYTGLFLLLTHLFVMWYEEPTLRRTFGQEYENYRQLVGRWWPSFSTKRDPKND